MVTLRGGPAKLASHVHGEQWWLPLSLTPPVPSLFSYRTGAYCRDLCREKHEHGVGQYCRPKTIGLSNAVGGCLNSRAHTDNPDRPPPHPPANQNNHTFLTLKRDIH